MKPLSYSIPWFVIYAHGFIRSVAIEQFCDGRLPGQVPRTVRKKIEPGCSLGPPKKYVPVIPMFHTPSESELTCAFRFLLSASTSYLREKITMKEMKIVPFYARKNIWHVVRSLTISATSFDPIPLMVDWLIDPTWEISFIFSIALFTLTHALRDGLIASHFLNVEVLTCWFTDNSIHCLSTTSHLSG